MTSRARAAKAIAVIPARYGSRRLPGKPLVDLAGRPLIQRVYLQAAKAKSLSRVIVATDDERIVRAVESIGEVVMTSLAHESGSDRVAEVVEGVDCDIVVNVQGDLPLLDPTLVDVLVSALAHDTAAGMATIAVPIRTSDELEDPSVVKVVCDAQNRALYFSRAPIPHNRELPGAISGALHHVGVYAYRRNTLLAFAALKPSTLETIERLEQLRALENGIGIAVVVCDGAPPQAVDTPEDVEAVRRMLAAEASR